MRICIDMGFVLMHCLHCYEVSAAVVTIENEMRLSLCVTKPSKWNILYVVLYIVSIVNVYDTNIVNIIYERVRIRSTSMYLIGFCCCFCSMCACVCVFHIYVFVTLNVAVCYNNLKSL